MLALAPALRGICAACGRPGAVASILVGRWRETICCVCVEWAERVIAYRYERIAETFRRSLGLPLP